jgi:hypothetical protein
MHTEFPTLDPDHAPDWRIRRALEILEGRAKADPYEDVGVRGILAFNSSLQCALISAQREVYGTRRDPASRYSITATFAKRSALLFALRLYFSSNAEQRAIVEAQLLAGESDKRIAASLNVAPETIEWYERACFDVRDRLGRPDYIVNLLRRADPRARRLDRETQLRFRTYKLAAYWGGSYVLDRVLAIVPIEDRPTSDLTVDAWFARAAQQAPAQAAAVAIAAERDPRHLVPLLKFANDLAWKTGRRGGGLTALEERFEELINEIPWELEARVEERTELEHSAATGAVEPRDDEMIEIINGHMPPALTDRTTAGDRDPSNVHDHDHDQKQ